ncbi:hypothetical protein CBS9595_002984 [Malassezia furfur]|nr:hypothetical protein CBS9595_002984 [Malassezia furfur]
MMSLGMMLAMAAIMALHLVFTAPYHYPLSRPNFVLQLIAAVLFLILVAAAVGYMLWDLRLHAMQVPHLFPYLSTPIPPKDGRWTMVQQGFFEVLLSFTVFTAHVRCKELTQATHIQFLTLLFPSKLEVWLILWLLGPLVVMQFITFYFKLIPSTSLAPPIGDVIQDICESTLSLLYSFALIAWSTLVNRHRAWRMDGAAALFGVATLVTALGKTVTSYVHIRFERAFWILVISWALTIWQSWLGFWWWVSAGMGIGEVEDRLRRQQRARKRYLHRKEQRYARRASARADASAAASTRARSSSRHSESAEAEGEAARSTSYEVPSEARLWLLRIGRTLYHYLPAAIRGRLDEVQREHDLAVLEAAVRQMNVVQKVTTRPNMLHERTLLHVQCEGQHACDDDDHDDAGAACAARHV